MNKLISSYIIIVFVVLMYSYYNYKDYKNLKAWHDGNLSKKKKKDFIISYIIGLIFLISLYILAILPKL